MSPNQLHILQHSLGVDQYGQGNQYRNRYVAGEEADCWPDLRHLVNLGLLHDHGSEKCFGGMHIFSVTDAGKEAMAKESPVPPKVSRAKGRYRDFLRADCGMTFIEWLKATARQKKARAHE